MKKTAVVKNYYVLPCCLLLLNLGLQLISYKAGMIRNGLLRTAFIMAMVLFGSGLAAYAVSPAIEVLVGALHRASRRNAGELGEVLFLTLLGVGVFWLYYEIYLIGPQAVLPAEWRNP